MSSDKLFKSEGYQSRRAQVIQELKKLVDLQGESQNGIY